MWIFHKLEVSSESKIFGSQVKVHLVTNVSQIPDLASSYLRVSEKWKVLMGSFLPPIRFPHNLLSNMWGKCSFLFSSEKWPKEEAIWTIAVEFLISILAKWWPRFLRILHFLRSICLLWVNTDTNKEELYALVGWFIKKAN